ncbi:MAG: lytic transglycosylase domain-containing protein, partial [Verrucomicrobiota bacterium]
MASKRTIQTWIAIGLLVASIATVLIVCSWMGTKREHRFDSEIMAAARKYKLEPALVKAVIWQESKFNPNAQGKAGEIGLMQIREEAAFEWADAEKIHPFEHREIFDPKKNIEAGTFYLSQLVKRYKNTDNPLPYALADYNAGRTHVLRWNKGAAKTNSEIFLSQMDFPGTRQYARNVIEKYSRY